MGIIIGMGSLSIASRIVAMILGKMNKVDDASMVEVVTTTLMVGTVVTAVTGAFAQVAKLGR
ncbi:MAG TPA: hypothetical protein VIM70_10620 [Clostridium sp.]|uniref:hypothetical protein n=1 Tax=Clostridium sp. TaxID=1506 RepID=UPI002F942D6B